MVLTYLKLSESTPSYKIALNEQENIRQHYVWLNTKIEGKDLDLNTIGPSNSCLQLKHIFLLLFSGINNSFSIITKGKLSVKNVCTSVQTVFM